MDLTCPHCSQTLELEPEVLAALQGQPHFACPACEGKLAVPAASTTPTTPTTPQRTGVHKPASTITKAQRGMNRMLLVPGMVTLVTLGGTGIFLASKNGGNPFQNITQQVLHNRHFTQLIADGVTTEKDLEAIAEIHPHEDGFIGVSNEALDWEASQDLAYRTGSRVVFLDKDGGGGLRDWLLITFGERVSQGIWVAEGVVVGVFDGAKVSTDKPLSRKCRIALWWSPQHSEQRRLAEDRDLTSALKSSDFLGRWKCVSDRGWTGDYHFFRHGFVSVTQPSDKLLVYPFVVEGDTLSWELPRTGRRTRLKLASSGKLSGISGHGTKMEATQVATDGNR